MADATQLAVEALADKLESQLKSVVDCLPISRVVRDGRLRAIRGNIGLKTISEVCNTLLVMQDGMHANLHTIPIMYACMPQAEYTQALKHLLGTAPDSRALREELDELKRAGCATGQRQPWSKR